LYRRAGTTFSREEGTLVCVYDDIADHLPIQDSRGMRLRELLLAEPHVELLDTRRLTEDLSITLRGAEPSIALVIGQADEHTARDLDDTLGCFSTIVRVPIARIEQPDGSYTLRHSASDAWEGLPEEIKALAPELRHPRVPQLV
jgi:hypothetical protein